MLKFLWGKGHQPTAERLKVQKELFGFSKCARHGFPNKPSAVAFDAKLKLIAVASKQGLLRVYGKPGVEFYGQHDSQVSKMLFLPGQGRLVSLTEDNQLHLWEINGKRLEEKKVTGLDGRLKQISVLCADMKKNQVLLGTEGGNIYHLNLKSFSIDDHIIYQDIVMQDSPEDFKVNPGAVEALLLHPKEPEKILIGYARGLMVLWDRSSTSACLTYVANQQLEDLAWRNDGSQFVSAHNDGSYMMWSSTSKEPLEPANTPYGPYPCKAITKIHWSHANGEAWLMFSGGMPRASYGDKSTLTVMKGDDSHVVFDLTSKLVDFFVVEEQDSVSGGNVPTSLFILAEEELVAVDLTSDTMPVFNLPYLNAIHGSAITCLTHVSDLTPGLMETIAQFGLNEHSNKISCQPWPITGGVLPTSMPKEPRDVLITGHEDGSVKFWHSAGLTLSPLATVKTNKYFIGDDLDEPREEEDGEEEWPPFRKVGHFDPYSDDPRVAVKKVAFCGHSGRLIIGGTAGQVVILDLMDSESEIELSPIKSDLVTEKEGFVWKGHHPLKVKTGPLKMNPGFQPTCIAQISPPASINSLGFSRNWGLVAVGTAHGLVILDSFQKIAVLAKCTLNAQDIANADDNPMSRRKSLKKSLRESFRRLRKGRSQRNLDKKKPSANQDPIKKEIRSDSPDTRPVERAIEARTGSEDGLGSMVRCIHFANTYIANPQTISATLWAGTNSGQILVFLLNIPVGGEEKRQSEKVSAMLAKEIQLKHKAPVITIQVLDGSGLPVGDGSGSGSSDESSNSFPHRVLIASEEQFKLFVLPMLKPCGKFKLTAHEGARIRKVGFTKFVSTSDPSYHENCFTCLSNQGDLSVHSLPDLRRQVVQTQCMMKEDVQAISSFIWTDQADGIFLCSSSELQRVTMAATNQLQMQTGSLTLAPDARPVIQEQQVSAKTNVDATAIKHKPIPSFGEETSFVSVPSVTVSSAAVDTHNETTISEVSADITLDSVKDHTVAQAHAEMSMMTSHSSITTVSKSTSRSIVLHETITSSCSPQEVSVVLNGQPIGLTEVSELMANACISAAQQTKFQLDQAEEKETETTEMAPLASLESASELQSLPAQKD